MRLGSLAAIALGVLGYALPAAAQADDTPSLQVITTFPQNEFNVVRNGQGNKVVFAITNPPGAERVLALEGVTGAFLNPLKEDGQRGRVLRNMTTLNLKKPRPIRAVGGQPVHQAFEFYSEFKPQPLDVEFRLAVRDGQTSRVYTLPVYRGQVTVVEPPVNWLDPQVLFIYLLLAGSALGGAAYYVRAQKAKKDAAAAKQARQQALKAAAPAPKQDGYDESWIPESSLKQRVQPPRKAKAQ